MTRLERPPPSRAEKNSDRYCIYVAPRNACQAGRSVSRAFHRLVPLVISVAEQAIEFLHEAHVPAVALPRRVTSRIDFGTRYSPIRPCTALVNYHHTLPLSQAWGSGTLVSSEGQRLPVSGKNRHARRIPPTLGYGMGVTFYSWTSDQLSQYGTKFVPVTVRDATYVLDELCNNETELLIREHTTDTAGATEIIFALFDLLGFRFAPRLRDLNDRRLFASGAIAMQRYPRLQPHLSHRINRPRILDWWDEMLRVAGSIKLGWVTASLLVQKLQAYPQQNALARALQEYGRLARTLHIIQWYAYPEERRRFLRQLNKGEALHDLRAFLMVANKGQLRQSRGEALTHQALCLNLVTNAVIVWNTVYMAAVVEQLKQEGYPVHDSDLAHVWPTRYAHVNVYGKYHFNIEEARGRHGLRPLRQPGHRG